ncbi:Nitrilase [Diatrype stigma]|uniref:Nitrilase n=1 Tax=Diatrype stigma TaxID=117547 RepID=A0AAN9V0R7_9PEZI
MTNTKIRLATASPGTQTTTKETLAQLHHIAKRAAANRADILLLPEAYIGGYPRGSDFGCKVGARTAEGRDDFLRYFKSAVDLGDTVGDGAGAGNAWVKRQLPGQLRPGATTTGGTVSATPGDGSDNSDDNVRGDGTREELERIARETGVFIVVGLIEKAGGSLYCAVGYVCPTLGFVGKRRKVQPDSTQPDSSATPGLVAVPPKQYATAKDWQSHKHIIEQLYLEEDRTLDQLITIMADRRNMFKKRIRAWGIDKKLKEDDVLEAMFLKAQRDAAGKPSELIIRGRVVGFERIWRYIERKPELRSIKWDRGRGRAAGKKSSGHVICRTPASSPPPMFIRSPPEYCRLEVALNGVRATIRLCVPSAAELNEGKKQPLNNILAGGDSGNARQSAQKQQQQQGCQKKSHSSPRMYQLLDEFTWLQTALDIGRPTAAIFQILNARLDQLVTVMKANSPEFIFHLLEICQFKFAGYAQLDRLLYRHIEELLIAVHGRNHPMAVSWAQIVDAIIASNGSSSSSSSSDGSSGEGAGSSSSSNSDNHHNNSNAYYLTGVLGRITELLRDELAALGEDDMAGFALNNMLRLRFHDGHTFDSLELLYRGWAAARPRPAWWRWGTPPGLICGDDDNSASDSDSNRGSNSDNGTTTNPSRYSDAANSAGSSQDDAYGGDGRSGKGNSEDSENSCSSYWPARIESIMHMIHCEMELAANRPDAAAACLRRVERSPAFHAHLASSPEVQASLAKLQGQVAWQHGERGGGDPGRDSPRCLARAEERLWTAVRIARTLRTRTDIEIDALQTLHDMYSRCVGLGLGGGLDVSAGLERTMRDIIALQRKLGLKDDRLVRMSISSPCRNAATSNLTTNTAATKSGGDGSGCIG